MGREKNSKRRDRGESGVSLIGTGWDGSRQQVSDLTYSDCLLKIISEIHITRQLDKNDV
jgi:hypothetical protein